ncbi:MAG TPA: glycosyltransferase family 2 protein [Ktedonobacterales bacterium]
MEDQERAVSIVVPVYNSAASLRALIERLQPVLATFGAGYEVILVNDGSRDASWQTIETLAREYPFIQGINLMRNFGQHNALLAGIRAARYPVIVTMDDDLQHPPEEIPLLLDKLDQGYDVVYGVPKRRPHSPWRNFTSWLIKRLMASVVRVKGAGQLSAFRAFRTEVRDAFAAYQSPTVFLDVLLSWGTTRFGAVKVRLDPRRAGKSNYTLRKLLRMAIMLLTGFSTAPLRFATFVGFIFTCFGVGVLGYVVVLAVLHGSVPGFPFLASIISLFSGAQLFALGIIGEYLAVTHNRLMERPVYVVRSRISAGANATTSAEPRPTAAPTAAPNASPTPAYARPTSGE